jgi:hypothetical protein
LTYAEHDPVREEGFEGHTHGCGARGGWCAVVWCGDVEVQLGVGSVVGTWMATLGIRDLSHPNSGGSCSDGGISPSTRSPAQRPLFSVSLGAADWPRSRKPASLRPDQPQIPPAAPATAARQRATSNAPPTLPHRLPASRGLATPYCISRTRNKHITYSAGHSNALRRLHDAPAAALHASTAEVSAARPIDAVESRVNIHSEPGVPGVQTGDCRVIRDGGARSAHGPDRDQRRPRRP